MLSIMDLVHALNRGVDKRQIFMDEHDYARFAYGLMIFNDTKSVDIASLHQKGLTMSFFREPAEARKKLVDIHGWCLMGNHYHLLLSERVENGISLFLKKLNIGYAKYFNERHRRSGTLFQGRTKQVRIEKEAHFLHILNYIHLNPLDFMSSNKKWRAGKITNPNKALKYIKQYKWSSCADYCKPANASVITTTGLFSEVYKDYEGELAMYLRDMDLETIGSLLLE